MIFLKLLWQGHEPRHPRAPPASWGLLRSVCLDATELYIPGLNHSNSADRCRRDGAAVARKIKPFRSHVTVVRKVVRPGLVGNMHPVVWRFTERALIESRTLPQDALYSVVEAYALCGGAKAANDSKTARLTGFCRSRFVG